MNNAVEANTLYASYFIVLNKIGYILKLKVKIVFIGAFFTTVPPENPLKG